MDENGIRMTWSLLEVAGARTIRNPDVSSAITISHKQTQLTRPIGKDIALISVNLEWGGEREREKESGSGGVVVLKLAVSFPMAHRVNHNAMVSGIVLFQSKF